MALAEKIENHDIETFHHTDRVAAFAYVIGRELGYGAVRLRELVLAAQMHDLGKIGLPPYILTKPGKLTAAEWAQVRLHPGKGWDILNRSTNTACIAPAIRHHHERYDGTGYPDELSADQIPIEARIISVADTFDALTSVRPYRRMMTIAEAQEEMRRVAGTQLDPELVAVVLKLLDDGTLVSRQSPGGAAPGELRKAI